MAFDDLTGSTGFQYGYPLLTALLAASGNRGAGVAQALNTGLGISNYYSQQQKNEQQKALEQQKIGDIFKTTKPVSSTSTVASMPVNPATAEFSLPSESDNRAAPPQPNTARGWQAAMAPAAVPLEKQTTVTQQPVFSPQAQKLGEALAAANRPDLALGIASKVLMKEPEKPHVFGSPETGYYGLTSGQQQPTELVKGVGRREATPPRPVFGTQGGEGVNSVYNPDTKQWETTRTPLTAAPAHQLSPEEQALSNARLRNEQARTGLIGAQTGAARSESDLRMQRLQNLKELASKANDPKTTTGQLSSSLNALLRERDSVAADDYSVSEKQDLNDAIRGIRSRLAELGRTQGAQGAQPAANANDPLGIRAPGKAIGKTKDGQIVYEAPDGKRYVAQSPGQLDATTAAQILKEAGGDKNKAREIARQRGYQF